MLVLTRRKFQGIFIHVGDVTIKVSHLGMDGNCVRFGIEAPKEVTILREEVPYSNDANKSRMESKDVS